jgi:hypothetical protein
MSLFRNTSRRSRVKAYGDPFEPDAVIALLFVPDDF